MNPRQKRTGLCHLRGYDRPARLAGRVGPAAILPDRVPVRCGVRVHVASTYVALPTDGILGTIFALLPRVCAIMVSNLSKSEEVNLLTSGANWAWPEALRRILRPRGVNLLVADSPDEFVHIIEHRRIHTTIVDMDSEKSNGLATIRIIRMDSPLLPCILLTGRANEAVLERALQLDVFGVLDKPVDMHLLRQVLHRLFVKKYNSDLFAD